MSSWQCNNCQLLNPNSNNQCIACFQYNKNIIWQCDQCNLLNRTNSSQCKACFNTIKPSFNIGSQWIRHCAYLDSINTEEIYVIKFIEWNHKLYLLIIFSDDSSITKFRIRMLPFKDEFNELKHNYSNVTETDRNQRGLKGASQCSISINQRTAKLYSLIHTYPDINTLLIYDLNEQNVKQQLYIDTRSVSTASETYINEIFCIYYDENNNNIISIITDVINNWSKQIKFVSSLPLEIYKIVHQFYSFIAHTNILQVLMLTEDKDPGDNPWNNLKSYSRNICHAIIDLNDLKMDNDKQEIALVVTNKEIIQYEEDFMEVERNASILRFKSNNELFWVFEQHDGGVLKVDIDNGIVSREKYMDPLLTDRVTQKNIRANDYDAFGMNGEEQYLSILTQDCSNPYWDLVCFDRKNSTAVIMKKRIKKQGSLRILDAKVFKDRLYVVHSITTNQVMVDIMYYKQSC